MDCIRLIRSEHARLEGRPLAPAFHMAVIEEALHYLNARITNSNGPLEPDERQELGAACTEALEALADLRTSRLNFP
jgi:hypothetical protein